MVPRNTVEQAVQLNADLEIRSTPESSWQSPFSQKDFPEDLLAQYADRYGLQWLHFGTSESEAKALSPQSFMRKLPVHDISVGRDGSEYSVVQMRPDTRPLLAAEIDS